MLLVDAMNVIGSRPTGWWRDRPGAVRGLVARLRRYAAEAGTPITVVVDGRPLPDLPEGRHGSVEVAYASRRGPDAADDRIVEIIEHLAAAGGSAGTVEVVTSDTELRRRVRALGAAVGRPSELLRALDRLDAGA